MKADRPGADRATVDDLDAPAVIVAHWGVLAAVCAALGLELASFTRERALADDSGGNWAALDFMGQERCVFYGFDHKYSDTTNIDAAVDVLDGGPDWLPWERLTAYAEEDQLGWCYWHEDGRWWRSGSAARSGLRDGHRQAAGFILDEGEALDHVSDLPTWGGGERLGSGVAAELLRRARDRTLDAGELATALEPAGVDADGLARALQSATFAGVTSGSRPPSAEPAAVAPPRRHRRRRRLSEEAHTQLVLAAMRDAGELPRPEPSRTGALRSFARTVERHGLLTPGSPGFAVQICGGGSTTSGVAMGSDVFADVVGQAGKLRRAEADPRAGRWIWLHVTGTPSRLPFGAPTLVLRRAYDHLPDFWTGAPHQMPWLSDLRAEIAGRDPGFRPAWARLLDPDVAWETV